MYTTKNFKTKKALKEAVAEYNATGNNPVTYYNPGSFGGTPSEGTIFLEGPHYPKPHTWYANCQAKNGVIISVK